MLLAADATGRRCYGPPMLRAADAAEPAMLRSRRCYGPAVLRSRRYSGSLLRTHSLVARTQAEFTFEPILPAFDHFAALGEDDVNDVGVECDGGAAEREGHDRQ
ncbi:MAG: hypothetical protein ACI81V_001206 [Lentimonas sp.]|jgi:hypothetical protein